MINEIEKVITEYNMYFSEHKSSVKETIDGFLVIYNLVINRFEIEAREFEFNNNDFELDDIMRHFPSINKYIIETNPDMSDEIRNMLNNQTKNLEEYFLEKRPFEFLFQFVLKESNEYYQLGLAFDIENYKKEYDSKTVTIPNLGTSIRYYDLCAPIEIYSDTLFAQHTKCTIGRI
jgi:hypothetical protein